VSQLDPWVLLVELLGMQKRPKRKKKDVCWVSKPYSFLLTMADSNDEQSLPQEKLKSCNSADENSLRVINSYNTFYTAIITATETAIVGTTTVRFFLKDPNNND